MRFKSLITLLAALLFCMPLSQAALRAEDTPAEVDWVPLFDRKDLKGWQGSGFWMVTEDGFEGRGPVAGMLQTNASYDDIQLKFDVKLTRGGAWALQLLPAQAKGPTVSINLGGLDSTGKMGDISINDELKQAANSGAADAGQWINMLVTLKDGQITVTANGSKVAECAAAELAGQRFKIGLSHPKGVTIGGFRNLQVQRRSIPAVAQGAKGIDLLKLTDPAKDTLTGTWEAQGGVLTSTVGAQVNHIEFPYIPPAEYDYRIVFNRDTGDDWITTIVAAGGKQFVFNYLARGDGVAGFAFVDGKPVQQNRSTNLHPAKLAEGKPHTILIKVRKDGMEATIDGEVMATIKTDYSDMSLNPAMKQHRDDTVGISAKDGLSIQSAEIIEMTGQGKPVRP